MRAREPQPTMAGMLTRFRGLHESYRYARAGDLEAITRTLTDAQVGTWLWFVPAPVDALRAYFRPLLAAQWDALTLGEPPDRGVFVVEDEGQDYLGFGAALPVAGSPGGFELGFQLEVRAWGRGVGTRLAWFLAAWSVHGAAGPDPAHRLQASCLEGNLASARILTKLGLQQEGRRPGYRLKQGARHTELLFGAQLSRLDAHALREVAEVHALLTSP